MFVPSPSDSGQADDIRACGEQLQTLAILVENDKKVGTYCRCIDSGPVRPSIVVILSPFPLQRGTVKNKGSHARNLDRLKNGLLFTVILIEQILEDPSRWAHLGHPGDRRLAARSHPLTGPALSFPPARQARLGAGR